MRKLVEQSVSQIWGEHCTSSDGKMTYEEAKKFIDSTFGGIS